MPADPDAAPPLPRELQVEVTGACNLACRMCLVRYRPKLGKATAALSFDAFRRLVDGIPGLRKVTLQGLGEPLLAPDLPRMVEYAAGRGIRTGFNTNGTLLTRERAERLVAAGLDWLHVSLDGATARTYEGVRDGARFDRVARNVAGLMAVRRRLGGARPTVSLVFVAMRRNVAELPDVVRLAHRWGVDRLWVQNLSHSFSDTDPAGDYAEIRAFAADEALWQGADAEADAAFAGARDVADALGVELRLPRLEAPAPEPLADGAARCGWPFESAYVTHDGLVQPCCMVMGADRAVLGDLRQRGFAEVWEGEPYRQFRAALRTDRPPDVCAGCSLLRRVF